MQARQVNNVQEWNRISKKLHAISPDVLMLVTHSIKNTHTAIPLLFQAFIKSMIKYTLTTALWGRRCSRVGKSGSLKGRTNSCPHLTPRFIHHPRLPEVGFTEELSLPGVKQCGQDHKRTGWFFQKKSSNYRTGREMWKRRAKKEKGKKHKKEEIQENALLRREQPLLMAA